MIDDNLFTCPQCKGVHYNITNGGLLICTSHINNMVGCGWTGPVSMSKSNELTQYIRNNRPIIENIVALSDIWDYQHYVIKIEYASEEVLDNLDTDSCELNDNLIDLIHDANVVLYNEP